MGDHTECFEIDFDPTIVTFAALLETFFSTHDATRPAHSAQYESLILCHHEHQAEEARAAAGRHTARLGREVLTRIQPYEGFTLAEEYHQKYALKGNKHVLTALQRAYPDPDALRDSTAAARLNGYLYGGGSLIQLRGEANSLGLDPETAEEVLRAGGA